MNMQGHQQKANISDRFCIPVIKYAATRAEEGGGSATFFHDDLDHTGSFW
jgi:L,D-peptidoglycan transpeptidase YkuD (ErfK/YbiS/YcfS/YnhG family)